MTDNDIARAAAAAIAATLSKALEDPHARSVLLSRDEALLALGIVQSVVEQIDRERVSSGYPDAR